MKNNNPQEVKVFLKYGEPDAYGTVFTKDSIINVSPDSNITIERTEEGVILKSYIKVQPIIGVKSIKINGIL